MAGKKKEGVAGLKGTSGGLRRDDRLASSKSIFDMITIDARNAMTVIYMLQSPEDNIVLKAVASLEIYGERSEANLQLLSSLGILQFLLPLVRVSDTVIKRFSQKLIGLLCSLEEFREQMFKLDDVLVTFVDILEKEPDVVMHEFSALTLAELTKECEGASKLLKIDNCIPTLFLRITSSDPDVQKNCLQIANHLLNDVFGIEHFIKCPYFDITRVLALVSSGYPAIQMLAIEVLLQLLSWHRDNTILFAFRDARGIESALEIMEKEEWSDLHTLALDLLTNVVDSTDLCESLLQTGCLVRFINLLETVDSGPFIEKILGVLGRMAQTQKGRMALHKLEAIPKFCYYLNARVDVVLQSCCMGLANMAQYALSLDSIVAENPFPQMLDILINGENDLDLRNTAAFALSVLATEERRVAEILLNLEKFETLYDILNDNNKSYPKELCSNIIQIFTGISAYEYLRTEIVTENFLIALINCIMSDGDSLGRGSSLEVDALECLCGYLTDQKAQFLFNKLGGPRKVFHCMKSRFAAVRDWAGQLVTVTSQNKDFVKAFIKIGGLDRLIEEKSTRFSMPSWDSAIRAIFSTFLPAKFAYTGRLDFQDITEDGFYVMSRPCHFFLPIEEYLDNLICPLHPIYVANFELSSVRDEMELIVESTSLESVHSELKSPNQIGVTDGKEPKVSMQKYMRGADRNSGEVLKQTESLITYPSVEYDESSNIRNEMQLSHRFAQFLPDPYLTGYLENLKKRIEIDEMECRDYNWFYIHPKLIRDKIRIIATVVAEEMSGFEPNPYCTQHYKNKFINEMKFQLGTTIFPLGYVRVGDYLERAMLFKVLADRIGFPCAMVRGSHGRAWIEIALPVVNVEEPGEEPNKCDTRVTISQMDRSSGKISSSFVKNHHAISNIGDENFWYPKLQMECFKAFPKHFLKPNAVVDLIDEPGRIFKMNTREADEYCGLLLFSQN